MTQRQASDPSTDARYSKTLVREMLETIADLRREGTIDAEQSDAFLLVWTLRLAQTEYVKSVYDMMQELEAEQKAEKEGRAERVKW